MGLLQHRNFCIDRQSNALWTRERQAPIPTNDGFTEIGLALIFPPNVGPTVFQVVEGSPAAMAGIATGDMILKLSGLPSEAINRYTAEKALSKAATERNQFEILISRGGKTVEKTVIPTVAMKL
jgi:S1-C subfamily serine protease